MVKGFNLGAGVSGIAIASANAIVFIVAAHFPIEFCNHSSAATEALATATATFIVALPFIRNRQHHLLGRILFSSLAPNLKPFVISAH